MVRLYTHVGENLINLGARQEAKCPKEKISKQNFYSWWGPDIFEKTGEPDAVWRGSDFWEPAFFYSVDTREIIGENTLR